LTQVGDVDVVAQGSNGIEAVDLIEEHHPDLVFLDVQMPGQDGFAVIQRLMDRNRAESAKAGGEKDVTPLPQFVFATAYDQYAVRAFDVNAVDYLLKPFDLARVSEAVERAAARIAAGSPPAGAAPERRLNRRLISSCACSIGRKTAQGRAPAKLIVQAQSRLLLVDQADICFAAIDEGVIRIVTRDLRGPIQVPHP
jgi:two-component system, LytTR family, response regulator LytT